MSTYNTIAPLGMNTTLRLLFLCSVYVYSALSTLCAAPLSSEVIGWKIHQTPVGQTVHVLDINPHQTHIVAVHADNQLPGRQTLSQMAKFHGALAGINGGFFRFNFFQNGFPAGVLKIKENWYGVSYRSRGAIGWSHNTPAAMDRIETKTTLTLNGHRMPIYYLNPSINPTTQRGGLFWPVFGSNNLSVPPHHTACLFTEQTVVQSLPSTTENQMIQLPKGHYLYIGPKNTLLDEACVTGAPVTLNIAVRTLKSAQETVEHTLPEWEKFEFIVGGAPLLIKNYQIVRDYDIERLTNDFVKQLHARSAIGLLEDGHWLLVVADQNLWNKDIGMTVPELARFMKTLGCKHAINLDGGISSGLYFNDRLINQPWFEREIGDAILVLP
jgi:hypothetical protein